MSDLTWYGCTRCGNPTQWQEGNPYNADHPLGRYCSSCIPILLEGIRQGIPTIKLIQQSARHRRLMDEMSSIVPNSFHASEE